MRERAQIGDFVKIKKYNGLYGKVEGVSDKFTTIKLIDKKGIFKGHLTLENYKLVLDEDNEIFSAMLKSTND
ncbi:hypothetical protein MBGDC06_00088 [Thermoplasmatales archaeon SCGC AB-539-C06]|nr:hypothetical protein MBGDC06_00088 [Thermoplasmatales archaeon SCGC AB-539-C06]